MLAVERERGWPDPVPRLADEGWRRFAERAPAGVRDLVDELRRAPWLLAEAVQDTPSTLLHGDWKLGNLGTRPDGRTILLDWAYPGAGPVGHDLAWYLALNRARLPESKEATITRFRAALEAHGVDTGGWWDRQLGLCLLGALVQFGWEKALGPDDELAWWVDAARSGARWL
jgi:aminoglycoside phosphotransferase (APT) family kinase protein